jgi:hypothetical protein
MNLKLQNVLFISYCLVLSAVADNAISLSGTIKNGEGVAIAGATINLIAKASLGNTSNAKGEFTIGNNSAIRGGNGFGTFSQNINCFGISGNKLRFSSTIPAHEGVVSVFSGNGTRIADIALGKMNAGLHALSLPALSAGVYVLSIRIDQFAQTWNIVNFDHETFLSTNGSVQKSVSPFSWSAAVANVDTLIVKKDGFTTVTLPIPSYKQTGIAIVMERTKFGPITVKDLPSINEMPDPLTMNDKTKVTTIDQWNVRRKEMVRILEDYEYGHMPPPGNVKASVATASSKITVSGSLQANYRKLHLTFGPGEKLGFDLGLFTPVTSPEGTGYPILIYLGYSSPTEKSLGDCSKALSRGYAVAIINYTDLGADATSWNKSAFFPSYKEYDWRDFSAWAWGISRAVDYIVTDSVFDKDKIMVTGVSRCGQPALLVGALDQRIALAAPVAGGMAMRFSGKEMGGGKGQGITEVVDQGTYWFGPNFESFRNQTPKLPCDQHWLVALTAPRLSIMCNSFADEYGRAYAAVQTYKYAKPVYDFLKVSDNVGLNFREGGHGMQAEDWAALLDFADQNLLKKPGTKKFDVIPPKDKTP